MARADHDRIVAAATRLLFARAGAILTLMNETIIPQTMLVIQLEAYEGIDGLVLSRRPVPQPGPGEVLVRVAAAPVNPSDLSFIRGDYAARPELPTVPGFEGSGTVVAAGSGLWPRLLRGRRVACAADARRGGTWGEYCLVSAASCLPLLGEVSLEQAATLIINPFTAWALLDLTRGGGHKALVQTGAAGALGRMILRLAGELGLTIINVVHREEQVALLRELGAAYVLNSSAPDFEQQLHDQCRELGVRLAIDGIAGPLTAQLLAAMPRQSEVVVYGSLSQEMISVHPGKLVFREQRIEGFWLSPWLRGMGLTRLLTTAYRVQKRLDTLLQTPVRAQPPLSEGIAAIRAYADNMTEGKILLTPRHTPGDVS